ncbi:13870_t:CDS:2, partial [Dentiscutata erythropus]
ALVGLNLQETQDKIGGPEIIVEIDKTKIRKRKHNHGHHVKVNHSLYYVDPNMCVYTNTIEETWNGIKLQVPPRNCTESEIPEEIMDREEISKGEERDEEKEREDSIEEIENKNRNHRNYER